MDEVAPARTRARSAVLTTLLVVLTQFALLVYVYHLDDDVARQHAAYARVSGILSTLGSQPEPQVASSSGRAVQNLVDSGIADGPAVRMTELYNTWISDTSDTVALEDLRAETNRIGEDIAADQARTDLVAAGVLAALLIIVCLGWFVWFRRLVRRHRVMERALTHKQALDDSEQRLLSLVRNSADLILVLDHDSSVSFASPSSATVLGWEPERLLGRRLVDMLPSEDAATLARHLVTQREGDHDLQVRLGHADGRTLVLEGSLTNLADDPSVRGWVLTLRDVTDRQSLQEQLAQQAFHDQLTGLANRQLLTDRLGHALARQVRRAEPLSVLVCDLDDFKHLNDSRGHSAGDQLLVEVGVRLLRALRPGDTAARLGGDEFAVLLEGSDAAQAEKVARRVQELLSEPFLVEGASLSLRASIGIAEAAPGTSTGDEVLRNADVAMYWAKDRGKSTVAVYESGLHALALEKMAIRGELQVAIREQQFVLHYQPTVNLATETITGFEALVRWQHPLRGLLPPATFIPIAEQSGLIVPLGEWVLREACHAAVTMQTPVQHPTIAVNIAAQQVVQNDFVDLVIDALEDAGLEPQQLTLEITESMLLDDMAGAIERLAALRSIGVHVAIDDFGTGYSSLSYLSRLPVDILKVDKSFVDEVCSGSHGASVTEAIIAMGRTMRLTTVAEGVELPEQAAWLQGAACTMGQGYLWSQPVELAAAHHLLRSGVPRQRLRTEIPRPNRIRRPTTGRG
ncbi:putative bifunctional diguanylate cyclase/phosphodiesterase [Nocardioides mesophilus]|uniref:EAL domain-containing protein n=1 Tax=Nocardioides mesophilus TaxID=433659 RepID=A0A7G9R977_9ACTN|nr:EAL domain-containing protein [Nocardioides mesophilus]QNN52152.1 EAL domain-containing protein [Nocardioides mesophilus]